MHRILPFRLRRWGTVLVCRAAVAAVGLVAVGLVAVGGCSRPGVEISAAAAERLSPVATAYVSVPQDGHFGTKVYGGSGREVASLIAHSLSARLRLVEVADDERPPRASLADARAGGFTYLIRPSILRWEDHASAWSGSPDRAEVLIEVIDAASGDITDVTVIEAHDLRIPSSSAAEDTPATALAAPLQAYAARLLPATAQK